MRIRHTRLAFTQHQGQVELTLNFPLVAVAQHENKCLPYQQLSNSEDLRFT